MGDERDRTGDEQCAGSSLGEPEDDQPFERWRKTAEGRGRREPGEPDRVDTPPAVVIGQGSGQDEERGECREVPADDIRLALEDADDGRRQLLSDLLERDVHDRAVEEDSTRSDDRRDEGPALAGGHRSKSGRCARRASRVRRRRWIDSPSMPGPVALVGAGEFLPAMSDFDAVLLGLTGRGRPRVAILPTASYPDGEDAFIHWATLGLSHFGDLGADVEPVLVRDRAGADDPAAAQAIGEADLVYLSGGKPGYLLGVLSGSAVGAALVDAHDRGAVIAGCSAGAMVLAAHAFDLRARIAPWPLRWRQALGIVPAGAVAAALRRLAGAAFGAHRAPGTPRLIGAWHRRGDGRHGPGWFVAGPWPFARHGVARTSPRAVSSRRESSALTSRRRRRRGTLSASQQRAGRRAAIWPKPASGGRNRVIR